MVLTSCLAYSLKFRRLVLFNVSQSSPRIGVPEEAFDLAPPQAASLAESLRAFGYELPTALADLVDNSITAGADHS